MEQIGYSNFCFSEILWRTSLSFPELVTVDLPSISLIFFRAICYFSRGTLTIIVAESGPIWKSRIFHSISENRLASSSSTSFIEQGNDDSMPTHLCFPRADLLSRAMAPGRGLP